MLNRKSKIENPKSCLWLCVCLLALVFLTACAEGQVTPPPESLASQSPSAEPTASLAPTVEVPTTTTSPGLTSSPPASLSLASPTVTASLPPATATTQPTPSPTVVPLLPPTRPVPTATPSVTPAINVPVQPVVRAGGTLNVGVVESGFKARNYSPYAPDLNETSQHLQRLVWNARLLYRDPVRLDWQPLAARTLPTVSPDGLRYTFTLRDGLAWSDGMPIRAKDYVFAYTSALRVEARFPHQDDLQLINLIEELDQRTLVITFKERYVNALEVINLLEPLPERIWSRYGFASPERNPEISRPTVTSGPFRPDASGLSFTAASNYLFGRPNLERINLNIYQTQAELLNALRTGTPGWTFQSLPASAVRQFQNASNLRLYRWTPQDAGRRYIGYNFANSFLQVKGVRQALGRTLDVRSLIVTVENGLAVEQNSFLPLVNEFALRPNPPPPSRFNIRAARDELKQAGFAQRDSDGQLVDDQSRRVRPLELIYLDSSPEANAIAVYVRQQYQQLGLEVNVNKLDPASYQKRRAAGEYDLEVGLVQIEGAFDPDDFKGQFISQGKLNYGGYSNPQLDNLFGEAFRLSEASQRLQRRQLYEQAQRIVADDAPVFFLYTLQAYTVMNGSLEPGGAGVINLPRWQLAWDAFPAYLNWYFS